MTLARFALMAIALVLALALWIFWPQQPVTGNSTIVSSQFKAPTVGATPKQVWKPGTTPSLPPADTPLKEIREQLIARAMSGDAPAACRWATELERCISIPYTKNFIRNKLEQAQNEHATAYVRELAEKEVVRQRERLAIAEQVCEGVLPAEASVAWKFTLSAAEAGHIPSMLHFADGSGMGQHMIPSRSDAAEAWTLHRAKAAGFLARAVEAGDPRAVYFSAVAHDRGKWNGERLLPKDRSLSLAHWQALKSVSSQDYARSLEELIRKMRESPPIEPREAAHVQRLSDEIAHKMLAANVREVDFRNGIFKGGKHLTCE